MYLSSPTVLKTGVPAATGAADALFLGADGDSRVSAEELAAAVLDELRTPATDRHFTVVHATG
ncbi:hypothetical protein [Streptomyces collinus]|uniref:hypothetical protein n=1 Tax=Streptomyces collinus TaxID=42684 RepID=UPI0036867449